MRLIPAFEASPKGYADLYQTVLVDTPIGPYFSQFLEQQQERLTNAAQVRKREAWSRRNMVGSVYPSFFMGFEVRVWHSSRVCCKNVWLVVRRVKNIVRKGTFALFGLGKCLKCCTG